MVKKCSGFLAGLSLLVGVSAHAGDVTIVGAELRSSGSGYSLSATLEHGDTGWDHYADAFEARLDDGTVLETRILLHPHVNEQPFTRSSSTFSIPEGVDSIRVYARDTEHGWSESFLTIPVP